MSPVPCILVTHIDFVCNSGRRDAIRLRKLWREKKNVPFKKSFLLEMLTISGCSGTRLDNLEAQVQAALVYVRDSILTCNVADPANGNNSLSDDLYAAQRAQIREAAANAAAAKNWGSVFNT